MLARLFSFLAPLFIFISIYAANPKTPDLRQNSELINSLYSVQFDTAVGNKDAKVIIFDFFDYNCGDCKTIDPMLEKLAENPQIKVIPIEYPILRPPSMYAAMVAIAALHQNKYVKLHHDFMTRTGRFSTQQEVDSAALEDGVDLSKVKSDNTIRTYLFKNLETGHKIGITNVPTLFIGYASAPHATSVLVEPKPEELLALVKKYLKE